MVQYLPTMGLHIYIHKIMETVSQYENGNITTQAFRSARNTLRLFTTERGIEILEERQRAQVEITGSRTELVTLARSVLASFTCNSFLEHKDSKGRYSWGVSSEVGFCELEVHFGKDGDLQLFCLIGVSNVVYYVPSRLMELNRRYPSWLRARGTRGVGGHPRCRDTRHMRDDFFPGAVDR